MLSIPMSDAQFATAATRLREKGIDLAGSSGTLTRNGVTANYTHENGTLTIEVTDKPMFMPLSVLEGTLRAYIEQSMESAPG